LLQSDTATTTSEEIGLYLLTQQQQRVEKYGIFGILNLEEIY